MSDLERRLEADNRSDPDYAGWSLSEGQLADRSYRRMVGGWWERNGRLQLDFLTARGLEPQHRLLDVGCGALRGGRQFVSYLDAGNYYGYDISHEIIEAGYHQELTDEQRARLPIANLRSTDRFDGDFGVQFDYAIAQSIFTHVPLNLVRLCLHRTAKVVKPGGTFFATFEEAPAGTPLDEVLADKHRQERNPYWYYRRDLRWAARDLPWEFTYIGKFGHPRGQRMVMYTRLDGDTQATAPEVPSAGLLSRVRRRLGRG